MANQGCQVSQVSGPEDVNFAAEDLADSQVRHGAAGRKTLKFGLYHSTVFPPAVKYKPWAAWGHRPDRTRNTLTIEAKRLVATCVTSK